MKQQRSTTCRTQAPKRRETLYAVLGVPPAATAEQLHAAFKQLAIANHPDKINGSARQLHDTHVKQEPLPMTFDNLVMLASCEVCRATARQAAVNYAYGILKDRQRRAAYDKQLALFSGRCTACSGQGITTQSSGFRSGRTRSVPCKACAGTGQEAV